MRLDGRQPDQLRPIHFVRQYTQYAPGSVLMTCGNTHILVTAMVEDKTPRHVSDPNTGWLTAEYAMLPGATQTRNNRERLRLSGRTQEIQRLIGRSLRSAIDLTQLGDRTILIDADVLQADGGTRTASITAAYVALVDAVHHLKATGIIETVPILKPVAAISVGVVDGIPMLDLNYEEDSQAHVDANLVMTEDGGIIEFQATSERFPLSRDELQQLLDLGESGIRQLFEAQRQALSQTLEATSVV